MQRGYVNVALFVVWVGPSLFLFVSIRARRFFCNHEIVFQMGPYYPTWAHMQTTKAIFLRIIIKALLTKRACKAKYEQLLEHQHAKVYIEPAITLFSKGRFFRGVLGHTCLNFVLRTIVLL